MYNLIAFIFFAFSLIFGLLITAYAVEKEKQNYGLIGVIVLMVSVAIASDAILKKGDVMYRRNTIEVRYEADENGIRLGDDLIIIDLSGTQPTMQMIDAKKEISNE